LTSPSTFVDRTKNWFYNRRWLVVTLLSGGAIAWLAEFSDSPLALTRLFRRPDLIEPVFIRRIEHPDSIRAFRRQWLGPDSLIGPRETFPLLDIAVRNAGNEPVIVTEIRLTATLLAFHEGPGIPCLRQTPAIANDYHALLGTRPLRQRAHIPAALSIEPRSTGRFVIAIGFAEIGSAEYDIALYLRYNRDRDATLGSTRLVLSTVCSLGPRVPSAWIVRAAPN